MFHEPTPYSNFISTLLSCESPEYQDIFDHGGEVDELVEQANKIIQTHTSTLKAIQGCRLDAILPAMLQHAPHPEGRRYVAIVLIVADQHGIVVVVDVARAWMDLLFKINMTLKEAVESEPDYFDESDDDSEEGTPNELRDLKKKIAEHEQYFCQISKELDSDYVTNLLRQNRSVPPCRGSTPMKLAHIVPPSLYTLQPYQPKEAPFIWAMLKAWSCIDIPKLRINSPANVIYMSMRYSALFHQFFFYLEPVGGTSNPQEYKARSTFKGDRLFRGEDQSHTTEEINIVFNSLGDVAPPDAKLVGFHAALAKVSEDSGVREHLSKFQVDLCEMCELEEEISELALQDI